MEDYINKINNLTYNYPTRTNHISLFDEDEVLETLESAYIIYHYKLIDLIYNFFLLKLNHGTNIEKEYYRTHFNINDNKREIVNNMLYRFISKRPLVFFLNCDQYLLKNGQDGAGGFDEINLDHKKSHKYIDHHLNINDLLTYDEIQISAMLSISSYVHFINNGARNNCGRNDQLNTFERMGVIIGSVGSRFEKKDQMDSQFILIQRDYNTIENGYGKDADINNSKTKLLRLWAEFYDEKYDNNLYYFQTWDEAIEYYNNNNENNKYIQINYDILFNTIAYKKRMKMSILPFLLNANERGRIKNELNNNNNDDNIIKVHLRVVGIGLGVWKKANIQNQLQLDVYYDIINSYELPYIDTLEFLWFANNTNQFGNINILNYNKNEYINTLNNNSIKILFTKNNPSDLVEENNLLVTMFAWDGNSYVGNEYWLGSLSASGDPAAACCSTLPYIQNVDVNDNILNNIPKPYGKENEQSEEDLNNNNNEEQKI